MRPGGGGKEACREAAWVRNGPPRSSHHGGLRNVSLLRSASFSLVLAVAAGARFSSLLFGNDEQTVQSKFCELDSVRRVVREPSPVSHVPEPVFAAAQDRSDRPPSVAGGFHVQCVAGPPVEVTRNAHVPGFRTEETKLDGSVLSHDRHDFRSLVNVVEQRSCHAPRKRAGKRRLWWALRVKRPVFPRESTFA